MPFLTTDGIGLEKFSTRRVYKVWLSINIHLHVRSVRIKLLLILVISDSAAIANFTKASLRFALLHLVLSVNKLWCVCLANQAHLIVYFCTNRWSLNFLLLSNCCELSSSQFALLPDAENFAPPLHYSFNSANKITIYTFVLFMSSFTICFVYHSCFLPLRHFVIFRCTFLFIYWKVNWAIFSDPLSS